ncbi:MAG TPA: OmpA family protein, partial [Candidatus Deferrimicrobium sp.]|nr:OmpA family protein [Candidatus Deferrimicrobium sp.]
YELLKQFPSAMVKIEGHCDERGTVEYNLSLGEKRARSAQDYLVGLGIEGNRISIQTFGKERPVDPGHNEEAWSKNRRAEFRVISQ